ncbi:MAG: hypothetical protein ACTHK7_11725 [Aureliella sp.]
MNKRIVAISCQMFNAADGPRFSVWKQAYGLRMTFDNEWPIETILMVPPYYISLVTSSDVLEETKTRAGASWFPGDGNLENIKKAQGYWILTYPTEDIGRILKANLGSLLYLPTVDDLNQVKGLPDADPSNLIVAIQTPVPTQLEETRALISELRMKLAEKGFAPDLMLLLSFGLDNSLAAELASLPEAEGILLLDLFPGEFADFAPRFLPVRQW